MMPAQPPQPPARAPSGTNSSTDPSPATARSFTAFLLPPPVTFYVQLGNGLQLELTPSPERLLSSLLGAGVGLGAGSGHMSAGAPSTGVPSTGSSAGPTAGPASTTTTTGPTTTGPTTTTTTTSTGPTMTGPTPTTAAAPPTISFVPIVFSTPFTVPLASLGGLGDLGGDAMLRAVHELFARSQSEARGPPPTSKAFLDALPLRAWDAAARASAKHTDCAICLSEYEAGELVLSLPCGHAFHKDCGMPWLVEHNVCPTCRHQLPTQEPVAEDKPAADAASASASGGAAGATGATGAADAGSAAPDASTASTNDGTSTTDGGESAEPEAEPMFERILRTLLGVRRERSPTFAEPQPARAVRQRVDESAAVDNGAAVQQSATEATGATLLPGAVPSDEVVGSSSGTHIGTGTAATAADSSDAALESLLEEEASRFVSEESDRRAAASASSAARDAADAAIFDAVDVAELLRDSRA